MANRLSSFIAKYPTITTKQFGFQSGKSTLHALTSLTEYIYKSINNKEHALGIFVDLKKAFDTVNHNILLLKLHHYGFRGLSYRWFESYLRDRKQCVKIQNSKSDYVSINVGVPQGSVLGPLLFLFYINDLPNVSQVLSTILFADDTTLSLTGEKYDDLIAVATAELDSVRNWMISNRLSLNVEKTFIIVFTNKLHDVNQASNVCFDDKIIKFCESGKFLGVTIDRRMSFGEHIEYVCSKVSKSIGIFYKLRESVPEHVLVKLYYSFVYPYLTYCNVIWGGTYDVHLTQLILIQKKIIRLITNESYLAHTGPLFFKTNILKINDLHTYLLAIEAYKSNEQSNFLYVQHSYDTRNRNNPVPSFQRLTSTQRSLSFSLPNVWNSLPLDVRQSHTLGIFKSRCKKYLINHYSDG
jgi:hypothetical protein